MIQLQLIQELIDEQTQAEILYNKDTEIEVQLFVFFYLVKCYLKINDITAASRFNFALEHYAECDAVNKELAKKLCECVNFRINTLTDVLSGGKMRFKYC